MRIMILLSILFITIAFALQATEQTQRQDADRVRFIETLGMCYDLYTFRAEYSNATVLRQRLEAETYYKFTDDELHARKLWNNGYFTGVAQPFDVTAEELTRRWLSDLDCYSFVDNQA